MAKNIKVNNSNVWEFIIHKHSSGTPAILLYVLHSEGSSPGRQGFKMAVAGDGNLYGTIGGGIMEHKFVEMAKARLKQGNEDHDVHRQIHDKAAGKNQSGMICSGEQTIFLYRIQDKDIPVIHAIVHSEKNNKNGTLELSGAGIRFSEEIPIDNFDFSQSGEEFMLNEKTGYKNILHIIGGGHCALALSKLMSGMDFYIHVYDERARLNTMQQNNFAHKKHFVKDYSEINLQIESGGSVYVVIMTFGYRTDDIAVRALMNKKFKYLGVLGSKKKMEKMFAHYRKENISEEFLTAIHTPIGLSIKSRTTAEIAVSIAGEIINVKNS